MTDILTSSSPRTDAEYETALQQMKGELERLNRLMEQDRKDIDRLKAESDLLKIETRAILATLGVSV